MLQTNTILSFPSLISLDTSPYDGQARRSWIQLARVGSFTSTRYGNFSITRSDLTQMLHNFNSVTPKAPTELPIDWDHLSMNPKQPGDGAAAGWMKRLELRKDGDELWAEVEWTRKGASAIEQKEYRFISPSFVKDHTHKDGSKIGTTLLAAAITNHPFLEGMNALTLFNASAMGDLGLPDTPAAIIDRTVHLAEIGQRLMFADDPELTPELTPAKRLLTVVVKSKLGEGDDQVVRVVTGSGDELGWFRMNQMKVADAPHKHDKENNPMPTNTQVDAMDATNALLNLAAEIREQHPGMSERDSYIAAGRKRTDLAGDGRRAELTGGSEEPSDIKPANPFHLRRDEGESLPTFVARVAREQCQGDHKAALRRVHDAFPEMVDAYSRGDTV